MRTLGRRLCLILLLILSGHAFAQDTNFYVITYLPGDSWQARTAYDKQPGIQQHLAYLQGLFNRDIILMSGPFADRAGGMVIISGSSLQAVKNIVSRDPAVISDLLLAEVSSWQVVMSSIRKRRRQTIEVDPDEPFTVESRDPEAPINLPK